jgi:hypothetical protein
MLALQEGGLCSRKLPSLRPNGDFADPLQLLWDTHANTPEVEGVFTKPDCGPAGFGGMQSTDAGERNRWKGRRDMKANVILIMVGLVGMAMPAAAATIPVTTTDPAVAADGQCSIIEAMDNANDDAQTHADCPAGSGADTVELASSATYELDEVYVSLFGATGLPVIVSEITIEGNDSTIRRAAGAPPFRFIAVDQMGDLTLNDMTLEGGNPGGNWLGGALANFGGRAFLARTTVTGNSAAGAGGIYNTSGPLTLLDSELSFNTGTAGVGGVAHNAANADATLVVEGSLIHGNQAIGSGAGGIYSYAPGAWRAVLMVTGSVISDNTAEFSGGGVRTEGSEVTVDDTTIRGNLTEYFCAGLFLVGGSGDIDRTTFSGNIVDNTVDYGTGGGLCVSDNTTTITNSTISGNQVLGPSTGQLMSGRGGGLSLVGGAFGAIPTVDTVVIVEDSTICDNTAETVGGGISVYRYAGTMAVELELRNTVIADNYEGGGAVLGNCIEEAPATISSLDFNLADDSTCNLIGTDDLVVADVMLSPLADNGGPTWTHLPETASPAIDSGDDAMCQATDQRGNVRPWDGDDDGQVHCDRGAVEFNAPFFYDGFESGDTTAWSNTAP